MLKNPTIGITTAESNSSNTLGLEIIYKEFLKAGHNIVFVDKKTARKVDILLVSLYWLDQVYEFPNWLISAKIKPRSGEPIIIIGGSMTLNLWPLEYFFDYAILGDGEGVAVEFVNALIAGKDFNSKAVVKSNNIENGGVCNVAPELPMDHYIELRTNKTTRVEIARGCKAKCRFCQLTHYKPYREIPPIILKNLISTSPTKNIALFAPDRGSYSGYKEIEGWCKKYGKRNLGTDIRLRTLRKMSVASSVRFGVEGFSERERKMVGKPYKNETLAENIIYALTKVKTAKGKPVTVLTWYMILGLPGQGVDDYKEFNYLLSLIDDKCENIKHKITIFLTLNDFCPMNHTPMENDFKDIYTDHAGIFKKMVIRPKNFALAIHGGNGPKAKRLIRALISRGGRESSRVVYDLSVNNHQIINGSDIKSVNKVKSIIHNNGVKIDDIINGYKTETPWRNILT